jgi:catechol 2,3-dioxygenase-like lactoylglutathione lyase family enzyme
MFDHLTVSVTSLEKSKEFYRIALLPLHLTILHEENDAVGFGKNRPMFWIGKADEKHPASTNVHIAFGCDNNDLVNRFYDAAIAAGGKDNGAPGFRPQYHEKYYGAFVLDPDGNNIEAVCQHHNE